MVRLAVGRTLQARALFCDTFVNVNSSKQLPQKIARASKSIEPHATWPGHDTHVMELRPLQESRDHGS